jgi:hypothetical protein
VRRMRRWVRLDQYCSFRHPPHSVNIHARIVRIPFGLEISRGRATRHNLHALFTLVGRRQGTIFTGLVIVVQNNNFAERVLNFIALSASLISPLLELREGDMLDGLSRLCPCASLEQIVVLGIHMTDMGDNGELHAARQSQLFCVTYPRCSLMTVSITPIS